MVKSGEDYCLLDGNVKLPQAKGRCWGFEGVVSPPNGPGRQPRFKSKIAVMRGEKGSKSAQ